VSKTNHSRQYKAPTPERLRVKYGSMGAHATGLLSDHGVGAKYFGFGSDRQNRRGKAGAKKFVRSRLRFHENQATQRLAGEF
jgi:hypothetical protein